MDSTIILADNQDITRAGLQFIIQQIDGCTVKRADDKAGMIDILKNQPMAVVVMDYSLFDINDVEELLILVYRFANVRWIIFSEDLSLDFVKRVIASSPFVSVLVAAVGWKIENKNNESSKITKAPQ